ncbi:lipopolysaccharide biosynthesis protein [Streptococcus equinus]|uniref:lipopolysaccharide biosynthesis protein n=1 Tax=Streptococcus equinus TaxID=1335 RepID=UPI0005F80A3A|nr:polysaccharide biosynthesis C-terminal domain-containing protein [Streptococcus equinus]
MSKQNELARNTVIIAFGKICTQLISFFLLPLYTEILSTKEYGTVDLILTYVSLFLPVATLALEQSVFRFLIDVRKNTKKKMEFITTSLAAATLIICLLEIVLFLCNLYFHSSVAGYFGVVLFASVYSTMFLQICRGLGDNLTYSLAGVLTAIIQIICNIIFLVFFDFGAKGMILSTILGNLSCAFFIYCRCNLRKFLSIKMYNKDTVIEMVRYSLPLVPNQLSWWALQASDKVIVQFFIGISGNGLLAVANKFPGVYMQFNTIFTISWTESATLHIHDEDAKQFFYKTINSFMNLFSSLCFGIIICMPVVFRIMVNSQYSDAYGIIPFYMMGSLFNALVSFYGVIYVAYKDTIQIMKTAIMAAIINVISHLLLIQFLGIYAAAISTMIGFGFMAIYRYFHSRRYIVVKLSYKFFVFSTIMMLFSFTGFYSNNLSIQVFSFIVVLLISIYINLEMINIIFLKLKEKVFSILCGR